MKKVSTTKRTISARFEGGTARLLGAGDILFMYLIRLCARVCHVCKNEEKFLFVNVFFANRSECEKIEKYSGESQKQMRCFDFHKIFQDLSYY